MSGSHNDSTPNLSGTLTVDEAADSDADGVNDAIDECANTPAVETANAVGCSPSQLDDDNDGVFNNADTCANTPAAETANAAGCSPSQVDDDNDGVFNNADTCANTPAAETANAAGCSPSQLDTDNDGVFNNADTCANTPAGETANAAGCSPSQVDDDNDGVFNNADTCANTPAVETANAVGCSPSQLDDDNDLVNNAIDECANTPAVETANAVGCSPSQLDDDNDLVNNAIDECANTPAVETANAVGCSPSQLDDDNDLVNNAIDECANTPAAETANAAGCSDGIADAVDTAPNTFSNAFSDGTTSGDITSRGDQDLTVTDSADPTKGVTIAASSGGVTPATVSACSGDSTYSLDSGDSFTVTCSSVIVDAITGTVEVTFIAPNGTVTTASLGAGNSLTLDNTVTFTVRAPLSNSVSVAIVVNSVPITLLPGSAVSTVDTDGDGVNNVIDQCPGTPFPTIAIVNAVGCSIDNDNDGITNDIDVEPNTGSFKASDRSFILNPGTFGGGTTDITIEKTGSLNNFACQIFHGGPALADIFEVDFDAQVRACRGRIKSVTDELPNVTTSAFGPKGIRVSMKDGDGDGLRQDHLRLVCDSPFCMREWNGRFYPSTYAVGDHYFVDRLVDHDNNPATPPLTARVKVRGPYEYVISAGSSRILVEAGSVDVSVGTGDDIIVFTVSAADGASGGLVLDNAEDGTLIATNESEAGAPPITFAINGEEAGSLNPGDPPLDIDTTPPVVTAALVPVGDGDDEGVFRVEFSVTDNLDPAPSVIAVLEVPGLADIPVTNGQVIEFEVDDEESEVESEDGILEIEAPSLTLRVTGTDADGNSAEATAIPTGLTGDGDDETEDDD